MTLKYVAGPGKQMIMIFESKLLGKQKLLSFYNNLWEF